MGFAASGEAVAILTVMISLVPLGDQAALAYFADEAAALRFAVVVRQANERWLVDVVQAYTSVAVFFDLDQTGFADVASRLRQYDQAGAREPVAAGRPRQSPC